MDPRYKKQIHHADGDCARMISAARDSIQDSTAHVEASHRAVERSLQLLRGRFYRLDG
jgi:hypothetical protein